MEFKVVEIPKGRATGETADIIQALQDNIGKAVEVPVYGRDPNTMRKNIRSAASNRGLLRQNAFRSRNSPDGSTLTVWLESKENVEAPASK